MNDRENTLHGRTLESETMMRPFQQKSSDLLRLSLKRRGDAGIVAISAAKITIFMCNFLICDFIFFGDFTEKYVFRYLERWQPFNKRKIKKSGKLYCLKYKKKLTISRCAHQLIEHCSHLLGSRHYSRLFEPLFLPTPRIRKNLLTLFCNVAFLAQL